MSRFRKLSHTIWHCQYHIVWVPKYRYRILTGGVAEEVARCIRAFVEQQKSKEPRRKRRGFKRPPIFAALFST